MPRFPPSTKCCNTRDLQNEVCCLPPPPPGHLAGELLRLRTLSRLAHLPYDGAGRAIEALLAGQVDIFISSLPAATLHVVSGQLKIIAISSKKRSLSFPNVPTVAESGIKDFEVTNWVGIFAPRATPKEIVAKLNREINQALAQQEVRDRLLNDAADITFMSPDQFADFVKSERGKYADLMRADFCSRLLFGGCEGFSQLP
jgi:tripartite-type tricarboxylate transporter receptor subunit TctC